MNALHLLEVLETAGHPVNVDKLGAQSEASARRIRASIRHLQEAAEANGFRLFQVSRHYYKLQVTDAVRYSAYKNRLVTTNIPRSEDRPRILAAMIAVETSYISTEDLADRLQTSKTTTQHDLAISEELLKRYNLRVDRKRSHGVRVEGLARDRLRFLAANYAHETAWIVETFEDLMREQELPLDASLQEIMEQHAIALPSNQLVFVRGLVLASEYMYWRHGSWMPEDTDDINQRLVTDLQALVARVCLYPISSEASRLLADALRNLGGNFENPHHDVKQLTQVVLDFLRQCDRESGTRFMDDALLVHMLCTHMMVLVNHTGQPPLSGGTVPEIEITHPESTTYGYRLAYALSSAFNVVFTRMDVMMITLHFAAHEERMKEARLARFTRIAVVCSGGYGGNYYSKMVLNQAFPKAQLELISYLNLDDLAIFKPDIIFSMVSSTLDTEVPVLHISELPQQHEIERIKQIMSYLSFDKQGKPYNKKHDSVWSQLTWAPLLVIEHATSYHDLLAEMGTKLIDAGWVTSNFVELLMERERFASTVYDNGICIPHPMESRALQDCIQVCLVKPPFDEGGRRVSIVIMIALKNEHQTWYKPINEQLYRMINSPAFAQMLETSITDEEVHMLFQIWERESHVS